MINIAIFGCVKCDCLIQHQSCLLRLGIYICLHLMPEYDIIVCQACKLSQIWSHMLQNDPIKIKANNYKIYDRLPNKVVYHLMVWINDPPLPTDGSDT